MDDQGWESAYFAREEIDRLGRLAHSYYRMADVERAAESYGHAVRLAEACGDNELIVSTRRWWGATMFEAGRLRQSLSALAPVLAMGLTEDAHEFYVAIVKYVEAAQLIPVRRQSIESAHQKLDAFVSDGGHESWRHMGLRLRSDFAYLRGQYAESLSFAEIAWRLAALTSGSHEPRFLFDEYLSCLVRAQLAVGDIAAANESLRDWQRQEDEIPSYRLVVLNARRSELELERNNPAKAIDYARTALVAAETANHYHCIILAAVALTRGLMEQDQLALAADTLARLEEKIGDESLVYRYQIELLRVDLELRVLEERPGFLDSNEDHSSPRQQRARKNEGVLGVNAQRSCDSLTKIGVKIDGLLDCHVWSERVGTRRARISQAAKKEH